MRVSAVVLAHGAEPYLADCLTALLSSTDVDLDVVVVDNGCEPPELVTGFDALPRLRVVRPSANLGFAGGCNEGARHADGDVLVFVNSDAIVAADALSRLAGTALDPAVGLATASVRLADSPALLNTAGNPWHLCGVVWAGHFGEPAARYDAPCDVATASGAAFAVRRDVWDALDGFEPSWFAYNEDAELSMRTWQRGWRVVYVPDAVVLHHYEFSRNPQKLYLLERNRLLNVLTLYQARTLVLLAPVLALFELGVLAVAARQGWVRQKLGGYAWIARHVTWLRARRRLVQSSREVPDGSLSHLFASKFDPANVESPSATVLVNGIVGPYWRLVRRFV